MKQFVFTEWNKKKLGILFEDGKAMEIRCYEADSILGNVYRARVSNLSPNINAAFVDIKKGESCYLSMDDYHGEKLKVGDLVTVQVVRDKIKTKRYAVTTDISLQGDYAVTTLFAPVGVSSKITDSARKKELKTLMQNLLIAEQDAQFYLAEGNVAEIERIKKLTLGGIIRTQAEHAEDAAITREIEGQARLLYSIMKKSEYATQYTCLYHTEVEYIKDIRRMHALQDVEIVTDIPEVTEAIPKLPLYTDEYTLTLRYSLASLLEKTLSKRAFLKSGAYLVIEPTEAMTVIDVNSGKSIKGKNAEDQFLKINIEAAKEIARQLRLRNISGIVMIDFINMKEESHNHELMKNLAEYVRTDPVRTTVVDMTKLGLVELTRQKGKRALHEVFSEIK
ncbi:MAG TPA: ribonuclease E/G [Lachnospiraceae bacterium]|jgi:ribonuclease G|nr:ribonuclease E/G [Lachnospiraceae bacterium]HBW54271.1 ribonuclease E/G [Lachnospiraceae bacterium]